MGWCRGGHDVEEFGEDGVNHEEVKQNIEGSCEWRDGEERGVCSCCECVKIQVC